MMVRSNRQMRILTHAPSRWRIIEKQGDFEARPRRGNRDAALVVKTINAISYHMHTYVQNYYNDWCMCWKGVCEMIGSV